MVLTNRVQLAAVWRQEQDVETSVCDQLVNALPPDYFGVLSWAIFPLCPAFVIGDVVHDKDCSLRVSRPVDHMALQEVPEADRIAALLRGVPLKACLLAGEGPIVK